MIIVVMVLVLLLMVSSYVSYNLYSKYQKLETISEENIEFILAIRSRVLSQQSYLRQIDRRGSFESDDEVGIFFKELKKIINDIASYLEIENEDDEKPSSTVLGNVTSER
jgi:hypothetical protein